MELIDAISVTFDQKHLNHQTKKCIFSMRIKNNPQKYLTKGNVQMNTRKTEKLLIKIFLALSIPVFGAIFVFSFLFSYINIHLLDENVFLVRDSIVITTFAALTVPALIMIIRNRFRPYIRRLDTRVPAVLLALLSILFCVLWVLNSGTAPRGDQNLICDAASQMNQGNYGYLEKGRYVAEFPHQLGIITLLRILFRLFGDGNFRSFQILNAFAVGFIVWYSYRIAEVLSSSKTVELLALTMSFLCLPMYFYTAFVYGEILSAALTCAALYQFMKLQTSFCGRRLLFLSFLTAGMLLIRKNTEIILIAMLGVMAVRLVLERRKTHFLVTAAILLGIVLKTITISAVYDSHIPDDAKAVPALAFIAMGTNNNTGYAGWFDRTNYNLFEQNDFDPEAASEDAREIIADFAAACMRDPCCGLRFYARKIMSQWSVPMYQCLVMNNRIRGRQSHLAAYIYHDASAWHFMDEYANLYQVTVYLSIVCLMLYSWKRPKQIWYYTGLIALYGGFLFSVLWEAKPRYIFPYLILMIPYAAVGLNMLSGKLRCQYRAFLRGVRKDGSL